MAKRKRRKHQASPNGGNGQIPLPGTEAKSADPGGPLFAQGAPPDPDVEEASPAPEPGSQRPVSPVTPSEPRSGPPAAASPPEGARHRPSSAGGHGADRSHEKPRAGEGRSVTAAGQAAQGSIDALIEAGEYRRAVPLLETSLEERPEDIALLLLSGKVFSAVGDYDRLMECMTEIMAWSHEEQGKGVFVVKFLPGYEAK